MTYVFTPGCIINTICEQNNISRLDRDMEDRTGDGYGLVVESRNSLRIQGTVF